MNTLNTNIAQALKQYSTDVEAAQTYAAFLIKNKDSALIQVTAALDESIGYALRSAIETLETRLIERVIHQSWANYFKAVNLYQTLGNKYYQAIEAYQFKDLSNNFLHHGVKALTPFTEENIKAFHTKYFSIDETELLADVKHFLLYCGSSSNPTKYKKSIMLTNAGRHANAISSHKAEVVAKLVKAIAFFNGDEKQTILGDIKQKLYNEFRVGETIELYEGVSAFVRPTLNMDIILSPKNVELLNSKL